MCDEAVFLRCIARCCSNRWTEMASLVWCCLLYFCHPAVWVEITFWRQKRPSSPHQLYSKLRHSVYEGLTSRCRLMPQDDYIPSLYFQNIEHYLPWYFIFSVNFCNDCSFLEPDWRGLRQRGICEMRNCSRNKKPTSVKADVCPLVPARLTIADKTLPCLQRAHSSSVFPTKKKCLWSRENLMNNTKALPHRMNSGCLHLNGASKVETFSGKIGQISAYHSAKVNGYFIYRTAGTCCGYWCSLTIICFHLCLSISRAPNTVAPLPH